jgi:hypothetical protein
MTTISIELYRQYLAVSATPSKGKVMPYDWGGLPKSLSISWMGYRLMFDEFSREIANSINQLTDYAHRLKTWSAVISSMTDQEKVNAAREFIDPLAVVGLTLPDVIRSRFIFAVAHLCHQANRALDGKKWRDDFPLDHEIYFPAADKYGARWRAYKSLKPRLEKINNKRYQTATCEFRHRTKSISCNRQHEHRNKKARRYRNNPPLPQKARSEDGRYPKTWRRECRSSGIDRQRNFALLRSQPTI